MGELTTKNQNLSKKEAIGQYVHDMVDLEIRAYSLRKTAEETRTKAEWEENRAKSSLVQAEGKKESSFKNWQSSLSSKFTFSSYFTDDIEHRPLQLWGIILGVLALSMGIVVLLYGIRPTNEITEDELIASLILSAVGIVILTVIFIYFRVGFGKELKSRVANINHLQNQYEKTEKELAEAQTKMKQNQIYIQKLRVHADQLDKDIAEIEKSLQQNYALNIVPPDYRRLECLLWIDYAFRNDQVDTMREATLQCDKWTRHEDKMKVFKELARNFRSIGELLESMNTNISMMNQDLFRIAEAQEKQLSETKSARYAMESIEQGVDRLAFYEEMKRHGTF